MSIRPVKQIIQSQPAIEGAGVRLNRAFGFGTTDEFDPFLLLDDFRNDRPEDYRAGFPWHPHRGIETITYVLAGTVAHGDSLGNSGRMGAGDVQWMTAGSGILHQEMPEGDAQGRMHGFQLWANLPASLKMTDPRYQDIKAAEIPEVVDDDGTRVKVICGDFWGRKGPVEGVAADPRYLDVWIAPRTRKTLPVEVDRHAFAYVFQGSGNFAGASEPFGVLTERTQSGVETLVREQATNRSARPFGIAAGCDRQVEVGVNAEPIGEILGGRVAHVDGHREAASRQAVSDPQDGVGRPVRSHLGCILGDLKATGEVGPVVVRLVLDDIPGGADGEPVDGVGLVAERDLVVIPLEGVPAFANPVGEGEQHGGAVAAGVARVPGEVGGRVEDFAQLAGGGQLQGEEVEAVRGEDRGGGPRRIVVQLVDGPAALGFGIDPVRHRGDHPFGSFADATRGIFGGESRPAHSNAVGAGLQMFRGRVRSKSLAVPFPGD